MPWSISRARAAVSSMAEAPGPWGTCAGRISGRELAGKAERQHPRHESETANSRLIREKLGMVASPFWEAMDLYFLRALKIRDFLGGITAIAGNARQRAFLAGLRADKLH